MKSAFRKLMILSAFGLAGAFGASQAHALTINGSGEVTDWSSIKPFTSVGASGITSVFENNYSPINYPNGIGHVPSPGGSLGEAFDLEEMHIRTNGTHVDVLLVASTLYQYNYYGSILKLGDLLIDENGDQAWDLGVVTQNANAGLTAGGLYDISTTIGLQNVSGSYINVPSVANAVGAWSIGSGTILSQNSIVTASHSYGGVENNTWLYQYSFDMPNSTWTSLDFQIAWGCGNDMIQGHIDYERGGPAPEPTPEPTTAALSLLGVGAITASLLRRRA